METYSRFELAFYNGEDREQVWVAYKGMIYDVTNSRYWRKGLHYKHWSGQDLTDEINDAPHNDNVFDKFKLVGKLEKDK